MDYRVAVRVSCKFRNKHEIRDEFPPAIPRQGARQHGELDSDAIEQKLVTDLLAPIDLLTLIQNLSARKGKPNFFHNYATAREKIAWPPGNILRPFAYPVR